MKLQWNDIFPIGTKINVGYTRFPNELVICTGEILEICEGTQTIKFKYLNGLFKGNSEISFREAFRFNYQWRPLYNAPNKE